MARCPVVVIAPGYGETKRDYLTLAYYFVSNGFHVIRYDHTNHVGESEGRHFESSLSSMKEDFQSVIQFARRQWPHSPVLGVASSLAARVALKAESELGGLDLPGIGFTHRMDHIPVDDGPLHEIDLAEKLERVGNAMEVIDAVMRADDLTPPEKLEAMRKAMRRLSKPGAAQAIVRQIVEVAGEKNP